METKKEKTNPLIKLIVILFIIFTAFYIALESGYYPSRVEKNTIIRSKEIAKFENDIKNNVYISDEGYIEKDVDYSNIVTKTGNALTNSLGKIIVEGTKGISDIFKYLFW